MNENDNNENNENNKNLEHNINEDLSKNEKSHHRCQHSDIHSPRHTRAAQQCQARSPDPSSSRVHTGGIPLSGYFLHIAHKSENNPPVEKAEQYRNGSFQTACRDNTRSLRKKAACSTTWS